MSDENNKQAQPASGFARNHGDAWDQLARNDSRRVPAFLLEDQSRFLGSLPLSPERYTSAEFFQRELKHMWPNVWQFAARAEELPDAGDTVLYENAGRSYILVRQADGSIRAFHNVCLHRGRKLRTSNGHVQELRCPYHAFTWKLDGSIQQVPCRWDFAHLSDSDLQLPEAQLDQWAGYVFIKENDGSETLAEYLGVLPEHFQRWEHERRYTTQWAGKVVKANWKAVAEAFMEAFHVIATHPQIMPFTGDVNSKYNLYGDHANLAITPFGDTSPHLHDKRLTQQEVIDSYLKYNGRVVPQGQSITVPEGKTARETMGGYNRERFAKAAGRDLDHASDAELQDALTYNVFPNFSPWGGFSPAVIYRWRPWPDQNHTLMEVRVLDYVPADMAHPRSVPMTMLTEDQNWASALGVLGSILDQDMGNLPHVQTGMQASKNGKLQLANYQESRIRHFHQTLDKYLEVGSE
jgi:phenylpropionate dioxygenase-like ring-hydroxylating dioxygenase large terminal subunit